MITVDVHSINNLPGFDRIVALVSSGGSRISRRRGTPDAPALKKLYVKTKELGPLGGAGGAPLDPPMVSSTINEQCRLSVTCKKQNFNTNKKKVFTYTKEEFLLSESRRRGVDSDDSWLDVTLIFLVLNEICTFSA